LSINGETVSNLRLFGIIIGCLGLLVTFLKYRGPKWKRSNFLMFSFINLSVIIVSINPNSINFIRDLLSLQEYQYSRIFSLLILSNLFLLFLTFYIKSKQGNISSQFDRIVRNIGAESLKKTVSDLHDKIKPIMIVIPAYNEAENLMELLPKIPHQINGIDVRAIVIDDGSEDKTKQVTLDHGHIVVSNLINRGGGAALRLGYDVLKDTNAGICVTMDADGQHLPEDISVLVSPILKDKYDFVIGSRILGSREKDSRFRLVGVYFFGYLISILLGKQITDPSSGFRAFKMNIIKSIQLVEDQYHTSELIIEAIKRGFRIGEVPITIFARKFGKSKKGKDWIYGIYFAKTIIKTWWRIIK